MPVIAPLWAWLVGLLGSLVTSVATWFVGRVAFEKAMQYALITAFIVASAALFLTLTISVKALILGARVAMPNSLGMATFFLPASVAQVFAAIVTVRVGASIYRWTIATMTAYLPITPRHMML